MKVEDDLLLVGPPVTGAPNPPPGRRGPNPLLTGLGAAVVLAVVVTVAAAEPARTPTTVAPEDLEAPSDPPVPATAGSEPAAPEWQELSVPGAGLVTTVVHGRPGWLAVVLDDRTRVLTSLDGTRWRETPLGTPALSAFLPTASSGAGVMVVAGGVPGSATPFSAWVSEDGGFGWVPAPFPDHAATLSSVASVTTGVYAAGTRDLAGGEEPVAWWLTSGRRWDPIPVRGGRIVDIVEFGGRAVAIGHDEGSASDGPGVPPGGPAPRLWTHEDGEFSPVETSMPDEVAGAVPVRARVDGFGNLVVALRDDERGTLTLIRSDDLATWEVLARLDDTSLHALGEFRGDPVVLGERAIRATGSGVEELALPADQVFLGLDTQGGLSVGGGLASDGTLALWAAGPRVDEAPVLAARPEAGWQEVARASGRFVGLLAPDWHRPRAVPHRDGALLTGGDARLLHVQQTGSTWQAVPGSPARAVLAVGAEAWITGPESLFRMDADDRVEAVRPGNPTEPAAVAVIEGTPIAMDAIGAAFRLTDQGWEPLATPRAPGGRPPIDLRGVRGGVVGRIPDDPDHTLVWAGGEAWHSVPGTLGPSVSGAQFLVVAARPDAATIELIDRWPEVTALEVPDPNPIEAVRVGGEIRVLTPGHVLVTADEGASWTQVAVESLRGTLVLLPTPEMAVASFERDRTRILVPAP